MRGYFFVYKRTLKSGKKVYYYQTYKPDGTLSSGKSTGCRTKSAAIHYCETLLMQGRIWSGSNIPFSSYAEHFFDNDSIWVQDKLASGTPDHPALSPLYLKKLQSTVRLHLLPYFGKMPLTFDNYFRIATGRSASAAASPNSQRCFVFFENSASTGLNSLI